MNQNIKKISIPIAVLLIIAAVFYIISGSRFETGGKATAAAVHDNGLTLIVDAGHGGADGGAVSLTGVKESELNMEIAAKIELIAAFYGVRTVMTRSSETLNYSEKSDTIREKKVEDQNRRLQLINGTNNAVLISIHQNIYPADGPFGAQVLYAPTTGSKEFADYMQKSLIRSLNTRNRRTAAEVPGSILLLNHIKCPAIIVECGFLSNAAEESLLRTDAYRLRLAAVITAGYLANQNTLSEIYPGG